MPAVLMMILLVVDWIMRQTKTDKRTGLQWVYMKQLEDLDNADGISVLSHKQDVQLRRVAEEAEKTGLQIDNRQQNPVRLHNLGSRCLSSWIESSVKMGRGR